MKKVTTLILAASALISASSVSFAQDAVAEQASVGSLTFTSSFVSEYMFRGARLGGASFQPSLEYTRGSGVLGVWSNFPLSGKVAGQSDPEFDLYGSLTYNTSNPAITIVPGFTLYTYPEATKSAGYYKETFEPSLAVNYTMACGIKITPKLYYDLMLDGATAELTGSYALPLTAIGSELDFTATIGDFMWRSFAENTSPDIKNWGSYYLIGVSAPIQVSKNGKLVLGVAFTKGWNNYLKQAGSSTTRNPGADDRAVASVNYSYAF